MISIKVINELFDNFHFSFHPHGHISMAQGDYETCGWWTLYWEVQPKKDSFRLVFMWIWWSANDVSYGIKTKKKQTKKKYIP